MKNTTENKELQKLVNIINSKIDEIDSGIINEGKLYIHQDLVPAIDELPSKIIYHDYDHSTVVYNYEVVQEDDLTMLKLKKYKI